MTLVNTSVWVHHFRRSDATLTRLLADNLVALHPFVFGEIAAGHLRNRAQTLADLALLARVPLAQESEVRYLLDSRRLWGTGLGRVDLHILTSAKLSGSSLYTTDRALNTAAASLKLAGPPPEQA
jgi:predicted nucleic acid-binding protein